MHQSGLTVGQKFPSSSNPVQDPYSSFRVKCDPVIKITSSSKIFTDDTSDTEAPVSRRKRKAMEPLEQTLLKRRLTRPVTGTGSFPSLSVLVVGGGVLQPESNWFV